jgi:hypothetical protein
MKLLTSQKDELFDLIEATDYFSPSQFDINEIQQKHNDYITEINFKNTSFFFRLIPESTYQGIFFANFSPGEKSIIEATSTLDWDRGTGYIDSWLDFLRKELTAENKWEKLFREIEYIKYAPIDDHSKFTYQEYIELTNKIEQVKASLSTIPLLEEQQVAIINQLNHLTELAKELNKYDWKNLFIGTIISIVIQLYVTRENAEKLWTLIKMIFSNFFLP